MSLYIYFKFGALIQLTEPYYITSINTTTLISNPVRYYLSTNNIEIRSITVAHPNYTACMTL